MEPVEELRRKEILKALKCEEEYVPSGDVYWVGSGTLWAVKRVRGDGKLAGDGHVVGHE